MDPLDRLLLEIYTTNSIPKEDDKIVYLVVDNSEEEDGVIRIVYASYNQEDQLDFYDKTPKSINWFIKPNHKIVNEKKMLKKLLDKMDGLDKMILKSTHQ